MNKSLTSVPKGSSFLLLILFEINVIFGVFSRSTISYSSLFKDAIPIVLLGMLILSFFTMKTSLYDLSWLAIGCLITILSSGIIGNLYLYIVLIVFSMRNSDILSLLKFTLISLVSAVIVVYLLAHFNKIPNLSFIRNGVFRSSLGMRFPLIFGAYVFYISSLLTILFGNRFPIRTSFILLALFIFAYNITNSRNDAFCIAFLFISIVVVHIKTDKIKAICYAGLTMTLLISCIIPFITLVFPYGGKSYFFLDKLMTGRLYYQDVLWSFYHPSLLGKSIPQVGLGGTNGIVMNYFYVDSSLTRLLFLGGILFFVFLVLTWSKFILFLTRNKIYLFALVMLVIWINGFIEDSMVDPTTDVFLCYLLINNKTSFRTYIDLSNTSANKN